MPQKAEVIVVAVLIYMNLSFPFYYKKAKIILYFHLLRIRSFIDPVLLFCKLLLASKIERSA